MVNVLNIRLPLVNTTVLYICHHADQYFEAVLKSWEYFAALTLWLTAPRANLLRKA